MLWQLVALLQPLGERTKAQAVPLNCGAPSRRCWVSVSGLKGRSSTVLQAGRQQRAPLVGAALLGFWASLQDRQWNRRF